MPRNKNFAPVPEVADDDPLKVMQEAQVDGMHENEGTEVDQSPEDRTDEAAERVTLIEQGTQAFEDLKDRYGEQFEDLKEVAKTKLRSIGSAAARIAKNAGLFAIGAGVVGVRAGIGAANRAHQGIKDRRARRQEARLEKERQAAQEKHMADLQEEALQENEVFDAHAEAIKENEMFDLHTEALNDNDEYDGWYNASRKFYENVTPGDADAFNAEPTTVGEDEYIIGAADRRARQDVINTAHEEALAENEQFDAEKAAERAAYEARVAARQKRYIAYRRREARRQKYEAVRDRGSEIYQAAAGRVKKTGSAIAKFAQRVKSAAASGARAVKASWQETAA